jgi:hypothetical protein
LSPKGVHDGGVTRLVAAAFLLPIGGLMLISCGAAQSTGASTPSAIPTTSASQSATAPSHTPQSGWKSYVSVRWGYSVDYPGDWYDLPNFGAPDTQKYFSNENVGAPLEMTASGVWETIGIEVNSTGPCPPSWVSRNAVRQSPATVDGEAATRYVINMTPSGGEAAYMIGVWVMHSGNCYSIQFQSSTPSTRDASADVADQTIASFKFGS